MNAVLQPASYDEFLVNKIAVRVEDAASVDTADLDPSLFSHQADGTRWALHRRRALIAMRFGLGKTAMQIALAKVLFQMEGSPFLQVCPLGVRHQFTEEDGPRMGVNWRYIRTDAEWEDEARVSPFLITNYERVRDGQIDPRKHAVSGISLDEGNVMRNLGSKTYQVFNEVCAHIPFRFVATAVPSPNCYRELIYYADFLGVMGRGECLTRWFKRNPNKAGDLTLMPQHEEEFWCWVSSWALFLNAPSEMGYSDEGYVLPPLRVHYHQVQTDHARAWTQADDRGQHHMFVDTQLSVSNAVREKRATLTARLDKAKEILASDPSAHWLLWHHLEDERRAIEKAIPSAVTIYGSQDLEEREEAVLDFTHGRIPLLASKPELSGSGCNFQRHCHSNIFLGINFSFEEFIQSIHRTHRFQQQHPVDVHIIYSEAESRVLEILKRKWEQHDILTAKMAEIVKRYGLNQAALASALKRKLGVERREVASNGYTLVRNDCVREMERLADNSVGLIHTSIPFGNHYEYTTNYEDMGHNKTDADFFAQLDFLIPHLVRALKPGRVAAIHVKDRILYGHQTKSGFMEVEEFSDDTVKAFKRHGFLYEGRRTIVTDVVRENNSTYRLGWSELCKDASKMGCGLPEYLLLFRKPPTRNAQQYADEPVRKIKQQYSRGRWQVDAHGLWRSNGLAFTPEQLSHMDPSSVSRAFALEQLNTPYDHERHVAICEAIDDKGRLPKTFMLLPPKVTREDDDPVWDDVVFMRSLNANQARAGAANHLCPLPFDVVERTIRLYSNPDDLVLDPFSGLGTVPLLALRLKRRAYGIELSEVYFDASVGYLKAEEEERATADMFTGNEMLDQVSA